MKFFLIYSILLGNCALIFAVTFQEQEIEATSNHLRHMVEVLDRQKNRLVEIKQQLESLSPQDPAHMVLKQQEQAVRIKIAELRMDIKLVADRRGELVQAWRKNFEGRDDLPQR